MFTFIIFFSYSICFNNVSFVALFLFIIYLANLAYKLKISNNKKSKEITQKDDELSNIKQEIKKLEVEIKQTLDKII